MSLTMYDDVTLSAEPQDGLYYGAYGDGSFANLAQAIAAFPHATILPITTRHIYDNSASFACLDVENFDANNSDAVEFVHLRAGKLCVLYTFAANVDALVATLEASGIKRWQYKIWSAHTGHGEHICGPHTCGECRQPDVDGTQWFQGNFDQSILLDNFFIMSGSPTPVPAPKTTTEVDDLFATDGKLVYRLSVYTPASMQKGNTTVEQWREFNKTQAELEAAGVHVWGPEVLAMWEIHKPSNA